MIYVICFSNSGGSTFAHKVGDFPLIIQQKVSSILFHRREVLPLYSRILCDHKSDCTLSCDGKGLETLKERPGDAMRHEGFTGTQVQDSRSSQLDDIAHCCCGQPQDYLHGIRGRRLPIQPGAKGQRYLLYQDRSCLCGQHPKEQSWSGGSSSQ